MCSRTPTHPIPSREAEVGQYDLSRAQAIQVHRYFQVEPLGIRREVERKHSS
ncbi:BQ5605_C012g06804 [Microbotryum silenes-dioicae]|uniref:BQ5605_C012g06804 protein n=1 Tax=Microbotryum silenes-dioicae TaxID=796604 RepID=A0A2X0LW64_9BASI|nr:BQ5605_C012g06804 [Microbotryum silenes-dioicae]